ncbi:hypothetical protein Q0N71_30790, partial [Bacillus thuringiensis]
DDGSGLAEGQMATGKIVIQGTNHVFEKDGTWSKNADTNEQPDGNVPSEFTGVKQIDGKTFKYVKGKSQKDPGYWYRDTDRDYRYVGRAGDLTGILQGEEATGWAKIEGHWYHFENTGKMNVGWKTDKVKLENGVEKTFKLYFYPKGNEGKHPVGSVARGEVTIPENGENYTYYFGELQGGDYTNENQLVPKPITDVAAADREKIGRQWRMHTGWRKQEQKFLYHTADGKQVEVHDKIPIRNGGHGNNPYYTTVHDKKTYYFQGEGLTIGFNERYGKGEWVHFAKTDEVLGEFIEGELLTGWHTILHNGKASRFNFYNSDEKQGLMATGWRRIGIRWYYFGIKGDGVENLAVGEMAKGWQTIAGKRYYFGMHEDGISGLGEGEMATDWKIIGGKRYYFGAENDKSGLSTGVMATGEYTIGGKTYFFNADRVELKPNKYELGEMVTGWVKGYFDYTKQGGWSWKWSTRYYDTNGVKAIGRQTIHNEKYYFNSKGNWCVGISIGPDGRLYRVEHDRDIIFGRSTSWIAVDPKRLEYSTSSTRSHYLLEIDKDGLIIQEKKDGEAFYKWYKEHHTGDSENHEDGFTYEKETGFQEIDGKTYYFAESDDEENHIGEGDMIIGWDDIKDEKGVERRYYFAEADDPDRQIEEGQMMTGFQTIKDDEKGVEKRYYFGIAGDGTSLHAGEMAKGSHIIDGERYYFNEEGQMAKGFHMIDGEQYYFNEEGQMVKSWFEIKGKWYRANADGKLTRGTFIWDRTDKYFFDKVTGESLFSIRMSSFVQGFKYYGYGPGGENADLVHGWKEDLERKRYYFGKFEDSPALSGGEMASGFQMIGGQTYYFGKLGDRTGLAEGQMAIWKTQIDGKWHYFQGDGAAWAANSWLGDYHQEGAPNTWYILEKGEMAAGWKEIGGKTYYFDPQNTNRKVTGRKMIDNKPYFFNENGEMVTAKGWQEIGGKKYYFNENGEMVAGFQTIDGERYYFYETGVMATDWFQEKGVKWHRTNADGKLNLGILIWNETDKYFFDKATGESLFSIRKKGDKYYGYGPGPDEGINVLQGWKTDFDGKEYYFGKKDDGTELTTGEMASGTAIRMGHIMYHFNDEGVCTKREIVV